MADPHSLGVELGLGLVQGITEFLPISSDGHLATYAMLFGMSDASLALIVLLHLGTLIATALVFRADLLRIARSALGAGASPAKFLATPDGVLLRNIVLACIPTAIIGLMLEKRVEALSRVPWVVGAGFLVSSVAVFSTRGRVAGRDSLTPRAALVLGTLQGIAVLPGVSRSALTIATALAAGMSAPAAFQFSFLLSLPAVAGAAALELLHPGVLAQFGAKAWLATLVSFASGCVALVALRRVLTRGHFWLFALYLVPLGVGLMAWDLLRG